MSRFAHNIRRFSIALLLLAGCAAPPVRHEEKTQPPAVTPAAHPWRMMIVYVPQTDDNAAQWVKWFARNPGLRMVIAMSPRFTHIAKDPVLRSQFLALRKSGRLEIALQLPNAPILPLIVDNPPYGYPDDVIQLVAQAKAGFFKTWNFLPQGLVLSYGAVSFKLVTILEHLGFPWMVAALGAPAADGPLQYSSLAIWDGSPVGKPAQTTVRVWDERQMKERPLEGWIVETRTKNGVFLLPADPGLSPVPLNLKSPWPPRTWDGTDWSSWVGWPAKDSAWSALRRTRETLEKYKNSGQASVQRLDVAFEEIYAAQSSNYFSVFDSTTVSPALIEEREHEFQATLLAIYRLISQSPPEDLFGTGPAAPVIGIHPSSTTVHAESLPDGRQHIDIEDAVGDALVAGGADLKSLNVWTSSTSVDWMVTLAQGAPSAIDIYIDLNGQPNAGTPSFLLGRPYTTSARDAWEYAISITGQTATLYRTEGAGTYGTVQTFPVVVEGSTYHVAIPRDLMRGNLRLWGYQVLVMSGTLSDFIDPVEISQKDLWQSLSDGKRSDIPFIRVRK